MQARAIHLSLITLVAVMVGCGADQSSMQSSKSNNQRGSSSLSSGEGQAACDPRYVEQHLGCGSEDHGATSGDSEVATVVKTTANPAAQSNTTTTQNNTAGTTPTPAPTQAAASNIVEFHIASGTGKGPWNTMAQMITIPVGKTLRIINDDTVPHRLHTPQRPCQHQPADMGPGGKYDCVIGQTFDPGTNAPLYDHNDGQAAAPFWVKAVP